MDGIDELRGRCFPVLDQGYVVLRDVIGDDAAICNAARISYGEGTRPVSDDRTLIRYLMRHRHSSPFEMAEVVLEVQCPMDVSRQWVRHRTASLNEYSTRYSEAIDAMQATPPDEWRSQAKDNKQGSAGPVTEWPEGYEVIEDARYDADDERIYPGEGDETFVTEGGRSWRRFERGADASPGRFLSDSEASLQSHARMVYEERLRFGVAREQARKDLPLSTYTRFVWKCDLRNTLHFLSLRMDSHAQREIRAYADVIGREIVAKLFPLTFAAFEDYTLGAVSLTALDIRVIRSLDGFTKPDENQYLNAVTWAKVGWPGLDGGRCREQDECRDKLVRLGIMGGEREDGADV